MNNFLFSEGLPEPILSLTRTSGGWALIVYYALKATHLSDMGTHCLSYLSSHQWVGAKMCGVILPKHGCKFWVPFEGAKKSILSLNELSLSLSRLILELIKARTLVAGVNLHLFPARGRFTACVACEETTIPQRRNRMFEQIVLLVLKRTDIVRAGLPAVFVFSAKKRDVHIPTITIL